MLLKVRIYNYIYMWDYISLIKLLSLWWDYIFFRFNLWKGNSDLIKFEISLYTRMCIDYVKVFKDI